MIIRENMKTKAMKTVNNELYIGNYRLKDLAQQYGTPLYVYDEAGVRDKIARYKKGLQSNLFKCNVVYASKAFLAPYLCDMLIENDFYIDGVSIGDMYLIQKSGYPMDHIVLHGNNKSNEELTYAVKNGVEYIVVDNKSELKRLIKIEEELKKNVKVLFRINPGIHAHTHAYIETSLLDSKFGESIYDLDIIDEMIKLCMENEYVEFNGFHAHIGSQITNADSFASEASAMLKFVNKIEKQYNINVNTLNLGGGFAIKYLDDDNEINIEEALEKMIAAVESEVKAGNVHIKRLMIEPGRSLVGDSGVTLYRCGGKKKTYAGKEYIFIDGGMPDNIRPALYDAEYTVGVANRVESDEKRTYDVVGKCCESGDIIAKGVEVGEVHEGDIIIVYSTGAYCYSMSMNYNGLTRGGVIFVGDTVKEVIKKQSLEDLVSTCVFKEK